MKTPAIFWKFRSDRRDFYQWKYSFNFSIFKFEVIAALRREILWFSHLTRKIELPKSGTIFLIEIERNTRYFFRRKPHSVISYDVKIIIETMKATKADDVPFFYPFFMKSKNFSLLFILNFPKSFLNRILRLCRTNLILSVLAKEISKKKHSVIELTLSSNSDGRNAHPDSTIRT